MAVEQRGTWFGFGFCGFGQALGSGDGRHMVYSPEPLRASGDVCIVSASWSYTALVTREQAHRRALLPAPLAVHPPHHLTTPG